ncbi:hypothetical protein D9758_016940 [Tetrapyrgos nigripes]|uniref:Uncharacterized protein n=1 Tax=Tetrapyrgos nigripes TaxID=182062 RepID=A0A8H5BZT2_9AGAR|nr:hypothetical protein D9758_016940 [Tetrapyrgos nigripes]
MYTPVLESLDNIIAHLDVILSFCKNHDNCALGPDGKLPDASLIAWDYDPDPTVVPPGSQTSSSPTSTSQTIRNTFDVLTSRGHAQATTVAGQCKSARTCCPTQKMLENNTSSTNSKRKASPSSECHPPARKVAKNQNQNKCSDDATDLDISDVDMDTLDKSETDDESEVQVLDYDTMKLLNAGDIFVAALSKASHTWDVYLIFEKAECTNPDTNVTQSGHICGICRKKQLPAKTCFMTGSVTSLCKHIAQQTTLDSVVVKQPTVEFSIAGLRDYIVELVVIKDKILQCAESVTNIIKAKIAGVPGKVSTTFDLWTSDPCNPYMSITAHYIWAPEDHPNDWTLQCEQLEFAPFFGHHSGANQAAVLTKAFEKFGIDRNKLGWQTADNASNNDTTMQNIAGVLNKANEGSELDSDDPEFWNASEQRIWCMEHCVHLGAGAFTKGITLTSSVIVPDPEQPEDNRNEDLSQVDEFAPGDVVGKFLALIRQIHASPQAHAYFKKCCISTNNQPLELKLWIRTWWASLHDALDRVIVLEKSWTLVEDNSRHPTLSKTIPTLEYMRSMWVAMSENTCFLPVKSALLKGIENIDKWYNKVDDSPAYFITLVLNPTIKLAYVMGKWHSDWVEAGMAALEHEASDL